MKGLYYYIFYRHGYNLNDMDPKKHIVMDPKKHIVLKFEGIWKVITKALN